MNYTIQIITKAKNQSEDKELEALVNNVRTSFGVEDDPDYLNNVVWFYDIESDLQLHRVIEFVRSHPLVEDVSYRDTEEDEAGICEVHIKPSDEQLCDSSEWTSKLAFLFSVTDRINNDRN